MRALSIRQPYAELISPESDGESRDLRGIKRIEYRSRATTIIGEPFYIYAARKPGDPTGFSELDCQPGDLPTGVIVGTATITGCTRQNGKYEWHLSDVKRLEHPRKPRRMPQPVWFRPF